MDKIVDNLTTLQRFLLLICAVVLILSVADDPRLKQDFRSEIGRLSEIETRYNQFRTEAAPDGTRYYRPIFLAAVPRKGAGWLRASLSRARFLPWLVDVQATDGQHWTLVLDQAEVATATFQALPAIGTLRASAPLYALPDRQALRERIAAILGERRPLFAAPDLTVYFYPTVGREGSCDFSFRSPTMEAQGQPPVTYQLPCSRVPVPIDYTGIYQGLLSPEVLGVGSAPVVLPPSFAPGRYSIDKRTLPALVDNLPDDSAEASKTAVLGADLDRLKFLRIGPLIIIAILVMMHGQTGALRQCAPDPDRKSLSWACQFIGLQALFSGLILCLLPLAAVVQANHVTYVPGAGAAAAGADPPWYSPALLGDQAVPLLEVLLTLLFSAALMIRNWLLVPRLGLARPRSVARRLVARYGRPDHLPRTTDPS